MSHSLLIAFVMFATVMFFTPGPNNIMLLSSGLTYGFRPTIPHIMGITVGFAFMIGAVGLGLGTIFIAYPVLQTILKYAGVAYLVYLAAHIAMSELPSAGFAGGLPKGGDLEPDAPREDMPIARRRPADTLGVTHAQPRGSPKPDLS